MFCCLFRIDKRERNKNLFITSLTKRIYNGISYCLTHITMLVVPAFVWLKDEQVVSDDMKAETMSVEC